ncbi:ABC transporter substrate-binding protein [Paenibacillus sp. UMB7766-LJ446]|uniref:ABC transporter substrate-binding protein n=1 Tax=Paenibacillus sp. UMB7766-LJ446 TaxID=3046313 RepID=UPI00254CCC9F|nr:ABC transporter substrate-binding protein [Paenibacillus sp. UMB7766-LJ446]MDK8191210.1 ABC transporter substrate-binding protein [Paenibacillus sp. UMB7766-LJ446]
MIRRNRRYSLPLTALVSTFLLLIVSGCSTGADHQATGAGTSPTAASNSTSGVSIRVGQTGWGNLELGLKAAGLDDTLYTVHYNVFQGGNLILEAMAANQLDFGVTSEIPPIFASQAANGGSFKIIAVQQGSTLNQEVVVPKDSPIQSIAELKGKKVAFVKNTTAHYFLLKMLEEAGLTWSDISPVELTTADGHSALISGKVEALASYGNAIISAHQNEAITIASAKDILSGSFLVAASDQALADEDQKKALADYLERINKFNEWARTHQEEWAQITADSTHQPLEQALKTYRDGEAQRPSRIVAISDNALKSEQDVADTFQQAGIFDQAVDVSRFWSDVLSDQLPAAEGK